MEDVEFVHLVFSNTILSKKFIKNIISVVPQPHEEGEYVGIYIRYLLPSDRVSELIIIYAHRDNVTKAVEEIHLHMK